MGGCTNRTTPPARRNRQPRAPGVLVVSSSSSSCTTSTHVVLGMHGMCCRVCERTVSRYIMYLSLTVHVPRNIFCCESRRGDREGSLNDAHRSCFRGIRVALGPGHSRVRGIGGVSSSPAGLCVSEASVETSTLVRTGYGRNCRHHALEVLKTLFRHPQPPPPGGGGQAGPRRALRGGANGPRSH